MTARALSFLRGYIRQWWHWVRTGHALRVARVNDRTVMLACWDCDEFFWSVYR